MKAILCTIGLILTMATSFSQSAGPDYKPIPDDPDSQAAAAMAQQFSEKLVSSDFKGAAKMMSSAEVLTDHNGSPSKKKSKTEFLKDKEKYLEQMWNKKTTISQVESSEVFSVGKPEEYKSLPDGSSVYSVQINFKLAGKEKPDPDRVSIVKLPNGAMEVWRILD